MMNERHIPAGSVPPKQTRITQDDTDITEAITMRISAATTLTFHLSFIRRAGRLQALVTKQIPPPGGSGPLISFYEVD